MDNVLFGPDPHPDAFSTTYSYDAAGNIRQLMRRGLIGTGQTLQSDTIDLLDYTYAGSDSLSSILVNVKDRASNPLAQPLGVTASENGYAHDGNGNLTIAGPVLQAQYNIMNLPTSIRTSAGKRHFAYVYGGGKYEARIEADTALSETRHYLGGIEFVDGNPESYNFGDGRIVYSDTVPPRPQFRLHDHLGNTVVFFEDKDNNGCITTEADTSGLAVEVLQRLWYYPFGMNMENLSTWETAPGQAYRYNGKERDTLSGWTDFGFRWYDAGIGRFTGVDPIADQFPWVSVFNYAENRPVDGVDLYGLQYVHFTALKYGNGSSIRRTHIQYTTPWTFNTLFGDYSVSYPLPKAFILNVGFDQFYFGSTSELFRAAQTIDWDHFDETHEVRGALLDPNKTLAAAEAMTEDIVSTAEKVATILMIKGGGKGNSSTLGLAKEARERTSKLRRLWEKVTGQKWPKEPDFLPDGSQNKYAGRKQSLSHKKALEDGGTNDVENIEPEPWKIHHERHKDNGDFKRWGKKNKN